MFKKFLSLLLFIGLAWGQDVLITKTGSEYKGEMLKAGDYDIQFKAEEMQSAQNVRIEAIKSLILSDGTKVVRNGNLVKRDLIIKEDNLKKMKSLRLSNISNPDTLIYQSGVRFSGRFLGIIFGGMKIFEGIKFETVNKEIVKPPMISIQKLSINTFTIINNGKWVVGKDFVRNIDKQTYDTYQKSIALKKIGLELSDVTIMSLNKSDDLLKIPQDYQQGVALAKQRKQKKLKFTQRVTRMGLIGGCGLGMWFWLVGNWTTW